MARLFNVALEEVTEEIDAAPAGEPLDEVEAIENSESAAADEAEINQGADEVTEALEEADALQEQVDVNDKILENTSDEVVEDAAASNIDNDVSGEVVVPESAVTESQVVEAQEALKYAIALFGNKVGYVNAVRVSTENAKRLSRREQLRIANEDAKDFIKKLIETAKRIIKQLAAKVVVWVKKIMLKFGNYSKAIDKVLGSIKGLTLSEEGAKKAKEKLVKDGGAYVKFALINGSYNIDILNNFGASILSTQKVLTAATTGEGGNLPQYEKYQIADLGKFGFKAVEGKVCGVDKASALVIGEKGYSKVTLEDNGVVQSKSLDVSKLSNDFVGKAVAVKKAISNAGNAFKTAQTLQAKAQSELDKLKSGDGENKDKVSSTVEIAKSVAITATMFKINEFLGAIKAFVKVGETLVANKGKGEEKPAEDKKEEAKA